ncbi:TROVE domain-containing protein [Longimicrobium terrae]|uniref:60 kDa SS-A/Ro ribonucleoprotein n=1 Tax=Longimicrobium terrae TaxID=1639882 RepID=A0A841H199_9BACT|nr:TROVE domain-containing protein [Longimicrobium terrae]MBB4637382.1 60 kDa SS-A/Ro ribonucleoprotein [Longimicrobium terrae]MBB6071780.1 60 kDa SS-A/Ro ribonucleoprotein [Longimicrobium terrae]NNC28540.1 TROVE domain-containing protein [Longimicrobium terrae]
MMDYTRYFATRFRAMLTPQSAPIPGSAQVRNSAGGYAWQLTPWDRLDRFLVLGSEGGTYYTTERALTAENARSAAACIAQDGPRVVARVVEMSESGRAPGNDPALFVLAMAAGLGDEPTRAAALAALTRVARTGTHLLHWLGFAGAFRGWGRGVRRAVSAWYTEREPRELAYQLLKYPSRDGWSHRDALRLAHPRPRSQEQQALFRRAVARGRGEEVAGDTPALALVRAADGLHRDSAAAPQAAAAIREHRLTWEMVPNRLLAHAEVWEALLESMPLTALIRNLAAMTRVGLIAPGSAAAAQVAARVADADALRRARVHPVRVLSALRTYARGKGRGAAGWAPVASVVDALDAAFYLAFGAVVPSGRRTLLALDVSGSMLANVLGLQGITCRDASAAMALVTAATEPAHQFVAFTAGPYASRWGATGTGLTPLAVSPRQRLDDVVAAVSGLPFGGTDCALPITEALRNRWAVDTFVVYTDNETWAGTVHPSQALREYRERMGIPAKLVVVGMASNGFSIADPEDAGMLDVVGFDAAAPQLIADFAR